MQTTCISIPINILTLGILVTTATANRESCSQVMLILDFQMLFSPHVLTLCSRCCFSAKMQDARCKSSFIRGSNKSLEAMACPTCIQAALDRIGLCHLTERALLQESESALWRRRRRRRNGDWMKVWTQTWLCWRSLLLACGSSGRKSDRQTDRHGDTKTVEVSVMLYCWTHTVRTT